MLKDYSKLTSLNEIKKGQTGTGLLIENDGHIIPPKDTISQIKEDINNGSKFVIPDDFIVSAVFQKYGIKNANGRIYPENVLKTQVDKYIRERVNTGCAIGALDHPSCQLADTRILTEKGWKFIYEVNVGENILTITPQKKIEIKPIQRVINEPYKGKLIHLKGRFIDIKVTPNHKFPILDRKQQWKGFYTALDILNGNIPDQSHSYLFKVGEWEGENDTEFIIPSLTEDELSIIPSNTLKEKYSKELRIPMEVWMKFMGIYLSEGCSNYRRNHNGCIVSICQKKKEIVEEIDTMLNEFPLGYKKKYRKNNGCVTFNIYDMRLAKYLDKFGNCYTKYVPYEIKKQNKEMLKIFYDWFVMGDGRGRGANSDNYYSDDVFSASEQLVMDLNEIQLKIGYCGSYHFEDRHYDRIIEGRLIKGENASNMHFTFRSHSKNIVLNPKSLKVTEEEYDGRVYCVEVENHTFYTMCNNGKCLWSGNSSSLSGHDVAMNILNLEWQGRTLVGEMKLHLSPGYKKYGICSTSGDLVANMLLDNILIGVSSRGVGSVRNEGGVTIVDDDYDIICWDVVCEPSTPNAFIKSNRDELRPFIESKENKNNSLNEKLNRIENILI
jgi:hypothetical protein